MKPLEVRSSYVKFLNHHSDFSEKRESGLDSRFLSPAFFAKHRSMPRYGTTYFLRRRRLLSTTLTLLNAIRAAAVIGLMWIEGTTPAASGTQTTL